MMENLCAVILAAGGGSRMNSVDKNKVSIPVNGIPMLTRTIKILRESGINKIVVVVGFAKESVTEILDRDIIVAEQNEQLGTGDAVKVALPYVPVNAKDIFIVYGDDSFLHSPQTYQNLYKTHTDNLSKITFITMDSDNPTGFGRIIRNDSGEITGIVEEKNATENERAIREINLGCYIVDKEYLMENIGKIKKNELTHEFYITDLIDIVASQNQKITSYKIKEGTWKGVNTPEDLRAAEGLF